MIGVPKALIAQGTIKALFRNEAQCTMSKVDILANDIEINDEIIVDATASERCLNFLCSKEKVMGCVVRTEIFADGIVGATFVEGSKRNPDIYDLRVTLWHKAIESQDVRNLLFVGNQEKNRELYIGIGCSSDTFVLDDAKTPNRQDVGKDVGLEVGLAVKIIELILDDSGIKMSEMAEKLEVTTRTIEREMKKLRESGRIIRVGGKRYGHWEVK
ncbi:MAG: helix-turn-helix domain-containing protein [Lachnospiraceae bacterium]|nr:helix-turn-helix domain-containing protein [Lachnospiraceae bacterium]